MLEKPDLFRTKDQILEAAKTDQTKATGSNSLVIQMWLSTSLQLWIKNCWSQWERDWTRWIKSKVPESDHNKLMEGESWVRSWPGSWTVKALVTDKSALCAILKDQRATVKLRGYATRSAVQEVPVQTILILWLLFKWMNTPLIPQPYTGGN